MLILDLKQKILSEIYSKGFKIFYNGNILNLFPSINKNHLKRALTELEDERKIKIFGKSLIYHDEFLTDFMGQITDSGVLEYESYDFKDETKYSIEIARFLKVIEENDKDYLDLDEIIKEMIKLGSERDPNDLSNFLRQTIEYTCDVVKKTSQGSNCYDLFHIPEIFNSLTDEGKQVIVKYQNFIELFQKPFIRSSRVLIIEEYCSLAILAENRLFKDACIKIGSILEHLITKWLKSKSISAISHSKTKKSINVDNSSFFDKVQYYIEYGSNIYSNEIGNMTQWGIVNSMIRDYRNYIHLQKYEEDRISKNNPLVKQDYESLRREFNIIIKLC